MSHNVIREKIYNFLKMSKKKDKSYICQRVIIAEILHTESTMSTDMHWFTSLPVETQQEIIGHLPAGDLVSLECSSTYTRSVLVAKFWTLGCLGCQIYMQCNCKLKYSQKFLCYVIAI